ncbi:MAG TPA: phage BR0599 family protein [Methylibium sp.]|nr:phage BR0599 family protein [Methylibium sp.]
MSYDARETSIAGGAPVEFYEFTRGSAAPQRYTSADGDIVLSGNTYVARTLRRGRIEASAERARNALQISCERTFPIAEMFRVAPPSDVIGVVVKRQHRDDVDVAVIWTGRVLNCAFNGLEAVLSCEPVTSSMKRPGLRRLYQRGCPHVLYGPGCGLNRASVSTLTTVTAISGLVLSVAALDAYPFAGGFVEWEVEPGVFERRFIGSFSSLNLTLTQPFQGIPIGAAVTVSPGCDHTMATCDGTYANVPNFGGFPFIPIKNPFAGTPVY